MIGRLNKRITIQSLSITDTPGGGAIEAWTDEFATWANVEPLRSSRDLQSNQVALMDGYKITIRWAAGRIISKEKRIVYSGQNLTINSIIEISEAQRFYEITAIAVS